MAGQAQAITPETESIMLDRAANGGWVVRQTWPNQPHRFEGPIAALSDDQAMVAWLAAQLSVQAPKPAIPPAEGEFDIGALAFEHTTAVLQLADIRKALKPLVEIAIHARDEEDGEWLSYAYDSDVDDEFETHLALGEIRKLLKAAGLFTADMLPAVSQESQARPPNPGPADPEPAASKSPPAEDLIDDDGVPF